MIKHDRIRAALLNVAFIILLSSAGHVFSQSPTGNVLGNLRILDEKEMRRTDPFTILREKPMSENATLVPSLIERANTLPPQYLYELARRLWPTDKVAAFEWYTVAMARARYDALRCIDKTSHQGIMFLPMIAPEVQKGTQTDRKAYGEAGLRAMARPDLFVDSVSPAWICFHGMGAIMAAMQSKRLMERDWLRPSSDWESIRSDIRKDMVQYLEAQDKPQDDPVSMTRRTFPTQSLPAKFSGAYGWLDSERLAVSSQERDSEGKSVWRISVFDGRGNHEEIAAATGMWCVGHGVVSFQTNQEKLDGNRQRLTLSTGSPGQWRSSVLELRQPFLSVGATQGFGRGWVLPANSVRHSPFDCRWEMNERLSGSKGADTWLPLLPGDGAVQFDLPGNAMFWITSKGERVKLPIGTESVSLESVRYLAWKRAYLVAPIWARLWHKEKTLPSCMTAALIYPDQARVEEVCAPLDTNNISNAAMFTQSKVGWLRAATERNTPHGGKPGGVYLVRFDGSTEKLIETNILNWTVSPDGCRVALRHRKANTGLYDLQVVDLCAAS